MSDTWKLTVNGVEKTFQDWGFLAPLEISHVSKAKSSITVETTEDFDATAQFQYGQVASFKKNGTQAFVGFVAVIKRSAVPDRKSISYTFYDVWWLLERLVFKQKRNEFDHWSGLPGSTPALRAVFSSEVYLGESLDEFGTHDQATGDQIKDVLNWINECYNPTRRGATGGIDASKDVVQIGQIDPAVIIPKSVLTNPFCSDVVTNLLRFSPDAVVSIDHSTTPVTLNVLSAVNLPVVTITLTVDQARQLKIAPKYDRQLAGVWIYYKSSVNVNGVDWPTLIIDKYPDGTGGDGPAITEYTPDVSVHTISLASGSLSTRTTIQTVPFASIYSGVVAAQKAWIIARDPSLQDAKVDPDSLQVLGPPTFKVIDDATGEEVADFSATPNELLHTAQPGFVGAATRVVTVSAEIRYAEYLDEDHVLQAHTVKRTFHKQITLTSALSTTYTDRSAQEAVPAGLAKNIYNSVKLLTHEGEITLTGSQYGAIKPGCALKIVTPANTYQLLPVQSSVSKPNSEDVTVQFGPSAILDANDMVELIRATRFARFDVPSGRSNPAGSGMEL